jgi:peptidyl-prolyl cis-trans isomerase A (cyclophilin A)
VANFIGLSQGTRTRICETSGEATQDPLYIGEKFFRVINDSTFKIAQTGSGTGTNSGGPGYTFVDEFSSDLRHDPYVLSMANSGPNTNGSQIFFTGDLSIPELDDVHTVFGKVTDPAGRAVIDAILNAGDDGSTISDVRILRTDPAALDFDESNEALPIILPAYGELKIENGETVSVTPDTELTKGDLITIFRSEDLSSGTWSAISFPFADFEQPSLTSIDLEPVSSSRAFYRLNRINHQNAWGPSSMAERTVTLQLPSGMLTYTFDATGQNGTTTYRPDNGEPFGGPFSLLNSDLKPYSSSLTIDTPSITPRYLLVSLGHDSESGANITSRHSTKSWNGTTWIPFDSGPATVSK